MLQFGDKVKRRRDSGAGCSGILNLIGKIA